MPTTTTKAINMPASPIRKLVPYAEQAKKEGKIVYHLNIGQPDIETPQIVLEKMKNLDLKVVEYSHSAGFQSYREGLAKYYNNLGIELDPDKEIMITTGGSEALIFAFQCCFEPGDEIIIPEPFYANYNGFAVTGGLKVVPVTAKIEDGFSLPSIEEFKKCITKKTKGILICNPGNPTGYLYSKEELQSLKEIVLENDLFLFADEVYREFCYDGATHFSALELEGLSQNVVLIDSVSKRYSMCGARVGALISKNHQLMEMALKFGQARLSPPTFGQIAGEEALKTPKSYFEKVCKIKKDKKFMKIYEIVEKEMIDKKNIHPNVDYPTGPTYHLMGFDTDFFTPIFVISRITGWSAHIMEQHASNKLIRPLAKYKGNKHRQVMLLNQR